MSENSNINIKIESENLSTEMPIPSLNPDSGRLIIVNICDITPVLEITAYLGHNGRDSAYPATVNKPV